MNNMKTATSSTLYSCSIFLFLYHSNPALCFSIYPTKENKNLYITSLPFFLNSTSGSISIPISAQGWSKASNNKEIGFVDLPSSPAAKYPRSASIKLRSIAVVRRAASISSGCDVDVM